MTRALRSLDDTRAIAAEIAKDLEAGTLVLLEGPMGAGKTQFTTFLVEALGGDEVASPSFAIHNSYEITRGKIEHFDLFRVTDVNDLESTGFWDIFEGDSIIVIEWAERLRDFGVEKQLPPARKIKRLRFAIDAAGVRTITL